VPDYVITKAFSSSVERTPRVLEVAESFGLGLSDKKFVIYDNLNVEVRSGDVVYITGQSGSGKSLLLRELRSQMRAAGIGIADIDEIKFPDKPVVDCLGKTTSEALDLLAKAGISDAWIYIRKPQELSDGQRYRLRLAMLMNMPVDVWCADEFGAVLDRITAKCVAFNMQKVARALGKTLIVATTHTDLAEELGPNLQVTKRFREKVEISHAA
jgi:ABC-type ATPase with predicted acetyltransferase domain